MLKLASWNVNSLRVRLPQVLDWLAAHQPDLVGLQETKLQNAQFPIEELAAAGYNVIANGQKTYNGVALLARQPLTPEAIALDIDDFDDPQRRVVAATCDNVRFINLYVPNGSEVGSDKYRYKLDWLDALLAWLATQRRQYANVVVVGDFNIAPEDRDVHDPELWRGSVLVSEPEREKFHQLLALGFKDSFRLFDQPEGSYSWWDYRAAAFRRNLGLRIDHILISDNLADSVTGATIDTAPRKLERPSDHAPVVTTVQL
ncbi:MAG: exodeoxyribonuclease III [Thiohalophilus sp.]|uniref:exodeoxyribonuclease III n=1 Tax=Thiohalophilus sp. TaxID=3028392 RepID=UPI00287062ED|nr:exodeoxyribonuclease III [Thiohalophilus sp.]MDR9435340.1 exodeoxyribonuclease III [Thiohalophilus sp.]